MKVVPEKKQTKTKQKQNQDDKQKWLNIFHHPKGFSSME